MTYLLNVALLICIILVFYNVLLRNETFFRLNRFMLLACLITAFLLPLIHLPPQWSFRKSPAVSSLSYQVPAVKDLAESLWTPLKADDSLKENAGFLGNISLTDLLILLYWTGVAVFAINFIVQLFTLIYRAYSRPTIRDGRYRIVELSGDQAPCSFGNNIFINPEKYEWETYSQILMHEKIHIQQGHSYDILLAEFALIFQWFNPFAWLYRKAVEDNLEFLTDHQLLEHQEIDPRSYKLSLVKVSAPHFPVSLTTNYNQSILKKRLIMINAKRSNLNSTWKYLFIAPLLLLFVCFLNEPKAYGKPGYPSIENEGAWFATIKNNNVNIRFEKDQDGKGSNNITFLLAEFDNLPRAKEDDFILRREAGTILFNGKFNGNIGMGTYKFNPDKDFINFLSREGINVNEHQDAMVFFTVDLKRSYVTMLKNQGYKGFTKDDLIALAALKIDEKFISTMKSNGFSHVSLEELIPLKALGVDGAYIQDIKKSGYKDLTVSQLITFKSQNITGDFIKSSQSAGKQAISKTTTRQNKIEESEQEEEEEDEESGSIFPAIENLIAMKAMNVNSEYKAGFKQMGYKFSDEDLIAMKALNVTTEFIKSLESAGFRNIPSDEVISSKALGITGDEIKEFKKLGYNNITFDEVISAKALGVTPAYISSMRKKGHNLSSIEKYVEAKAVSTILPW